MALTRKMKILNRSWIKPGELQMQRGQRHTSNPVLAKKAVNDNGLNCGYHTCLLTSPRTIGSLLWSLYWPPKCWPETNRLQDISPAKTGLSGISRELQFGVCNHGNPPMAREGGQFYREEKEVERALVNRESMVFHWLSPCWERRGDFLLPVGLCFHHRECELPLMVSQFYLIEVSVY